MDEWTTNDGGSKVQIVIIQTMNSTRLPFMAFCYAKLTKCCDCYFGERCMFVFFLIFCMSDHLSVTVCVFVVHSIGFSFLNMFSYSYHEYQC